MFSSLKKQTARTTPHLIILLIFKLNNGLVNHIFSNLWNVYTLSEKNYLQGNFYSILLLSPSVIWVHGDAALPVSEIANFPLWTLVCSSSIG